VYRLRVFFVMTFLQMVFELSIWSGLAGQGHPVTAMAAEAGAAEVGAACPDRFAKRDGTRLNHSIVQEAHPLPGHDRRSVPVAV
jgi:hypothetical protein